MGRERRIRLTLNLSFLLLIFSVGIVQAVIELRRGEPVQVLELFEEAPSVASLRAFEKRLEDQSIVAAELRPWLQYARFRLFGNAGTEALVGLDGWWYYGRGVDYLTQNEPDPPLEGFGRAAAVSAIVDFRDQLASRGVALLVVPVPGKAGVYPDRLSPLAEGPLTRTITDALIADLVVEGVAVVDLLGVFRTYRAEREAGVEDSLYLPEDTHWSPRGVRLAARTIARRIREMNVSTTDSMVFDTRPVVVQRLGDVIQMLKSPPVEALFPAREVHCEQVVSATTGEVYRDDPDADVLVLGDSFLRIYERDEPGSAGLLAHLARELGRPVASIVNDGGASTLVRQQLATQIVRLEGKKLVVWEFVERDVRFGLEGWQSVPLQ